MDVEKIFNDLESNQTQECEEAKRKLVELFSQSKEQWLVHNMMDYVLKTGSLRIMEVLVKVQSPHDSYIFDRLADWLKTHTYRVQALNLFCFVVRKHPTWLFKVERHRLIKEILKLLLTEKEIVPLMSALLCIITLLPIIPNLVPNFLNDLFEVFGHLASWNCQNPNRLSDDKLVHLQLGLQTLFHRLYGMFPWNFLAYLSDFIRKDKGAIFHHTIKPLLETVRVHPLLVTATIESEMSNSRWKEMEPHDVVVECAKLSLPVINQDLNVEQTQQFTSSDLLYTPGEIRRSPLISHMHNSSSHFNTNQFMELQYRKDPIFRRESAVNSRSDALAWNPPPTAPYFKDQRYRSELHDRFDSGSNTSTNAIIWSPYNEITASGPIPLTPTPSYILPLTTTATASLSNQLLGVSGSSPPEAAVEATPETTPLKDIKDRTHATMVSASPVANTNPHAVRAIFVSSQPSSPMRQEQSQFSFPDMASDTLHTSTIVEQEVNTRLVTRITKTYDRRLQQMIQDRIHSPSPFQTIEAQAAKQGYRSPIDASSKCETPEIDSENSSQLITNPTPIRTLISTPVEHITKICDNCNETDRSMCTAGGLHIPTSRSMQILAKVVKRRNRMASYCYNDSSCEKISTNKKEVTENNAGSNAKVRRTKSCSSICISSIKSDEDFDSDINNLSIIQQSERRLQKSGKMLAIAKATKRTLDTTSYANAGTQTLETVPKHYENSLFEILIESKKLRNAYEGRLLHPHDILDQYISRTMHYKDNFETGFRFDQDHYQLLCLQLQYERYRREIHAERNRRLMGRSRDKRSLEMERDRLNEQLTNFATKNKELVQQIDQTMKAANERKQMYTEELSALKAKYQYEVDQNKCLRQANENLQTRLNEELASRKEINYELEALRGQIFNLNTELQHAQSQAEMGLQYKQELARLEAEFIVMGEVQIKCRDRLAEIDNYKARDEELHMLQESYSTDLKDLKRSLEERSSQFDCARNKILELQNQLINSEKIITEQKRVLKTVKDEYEEKFKSLNKKYDVQKIIIMQMEEKIMMSLHKPQAAIATNACSPDTDKTDIASSMDRNSPLSTSLASSESLSASLRSTELRNLQQLVETPIPETHSSISVAGPGTNIVEGTRVPTQLDFSASGSASTINVVSSTSHTMAYNFDMVSTTTSHSHSHPHQPQQKS